MASSSAAPPQPPAEAAVDSPASDGADSISQSSTTPNNSATPPPPPSAFGDSDRKSPEPATGGKRDAAAAGNANPREAESVEESADAPKDAGPMPYESANIFSILTFEWLTSIFIKGWKRPLEFSDMWQIGQHMDTTTLADRFESAWKADLLEKPVGQEEAAVAEARRKAALAQEGKKKKKEKPPASTEGVRLRRVLLKLFLAEFWPLGIIKFLADMCSTFSPLLVKYIITYAAEAYYGPLSLNLLPPPPPRYGLAIGLFFVQVTGSLLTGNFFQRATQVGIRARVTMSGVIYRKSLRLSSGARQEFNSGRVVNMVATDTNRIELFVSFAHIIWTAPIQILIIVAFLISQIGWAAIGMLFKTLSQIRRTVAPLTDRRVKLTTEVLSGIRVIKFFAWENPFLTMIEDVRKAEVAQVKKRSLLSAFVMTIAFGIPVISAAVAFVLFGIQNTLEASKVFSSLSWFQQLRFPLMFLPNLITSWADFSIAMARIESFLLAPELDELPAVVPDSQYGLEIIDGEFEWEAPPPLSAAFTPGGGRGGRGGPGGGGAKGKKGDKGKESGKEPGKPPVASDAPLKPTKPDRPTLRNITLRVPKGTLVAVVGAVGSGKSSLLNAVIGEMKKRRGTMTVAGKVGYAPQTAWIQNATLKENVLFGQPYDRDRYLRALHTCALEQDLRILPGGDQTSIGERGINLSGGQKQRVNLARTVYHGSDLVLLDDPLSAVDAHVGKFLFEECILGALKGRTRVLVTHQLHVLSRVDMVVVMRDGEIAEQGSFAELMAKEDGEFARLMHNYGAEEEEKAEETAEERDANAVAGKARIEALDNLTSKPVNAQDIMQVEDRQTGTVAAGVWLTYTKASGGPFFLVGLLAVLAGVQSTRVVNDLWLTWWSDGKYNDKFSLMGYVGVYFGLGISQSVATYIFGIFFAYSGTRAARVLHEGAMKRVMRAPSRFFDTTPLGRIINRFSKDQDGVDNSLADAFRMFCNTLASSISTFIIIVYATPLFAAPLVPMLVVYYFLQKLYRETSRELKRLDSISRSPLYANFGETLSGLATIRAYREEARFIANNDRATNGNNSPYFLLITAQRWLSLRLETLGAVLVFCACAFGIIANKSLSPALFGLSLSYSLQVTQILNFCIRQFTDTEIAMNSVERVEHYSNRIEVEADAVVPHNRPPTNWPVKGDVTFTDVSMSYSPELPLVLKQVSFSVKDGEKVGIVGRTGSGKSSLMQALFRMVEISDGKVTIDGIDASTLGLFDLRKNLAIIPQDPVLFTGTYRSNLDPFSEYDDNQLWDALERAGLKSKVVEDDKGLEGKVTEGGENLSVGQRQLLCLARAMLKKPKILVMDEATANVDYETDALIQKSLREDFAAATVLTVAHRLNTVVDYDRVLVMGDGKVLEYDEPSVLLERDDSVFKSMVAETGDGNALLLKGLADEASAKRRNGKAGPSA
ncbi:P-loop containing nucleoside triphosphate hydrolase protein [Zopfochytrium polystomum]|nr:P-loop containing nucleoside triphosphate hydrolase protein [Zopfochytrium polystomum]